MSMRKLRILYPSPILLVGRLFWLTGMAFSLVLIYWAVEDVMQSGLHFENGLMYSFLALIFILGGYAAFHLWPLIFGELTLTADYVKWHALFMRSVKIPYSELRYVEIRHFDEGNVVPDLYGTGQMYLLLSSKSLPKKRIDKIRSGDGLIKYQFLMRDAEVFSEYLPERYKPMFQSRAEAYTRAKEKRARDWQKWKAKRKKAREKRRKKRQVEKYEKH